jgi:hypothetical protein
MGVVVAVPDRRHFGLPPRSTGSLRNASTWSLGKVEASRRRPFRAVVDRASVFLEAVTATTAESGRSPSSSFTSRVMA